MLHRLIRALDGISGAAGRFVMWLVLALVVTQFAVVILRYVFSTGSIPLQESVVYLHALVFLLGAGFTLRSDEHVRIDIFYARATTRRRAWIDLLGVVFLLLPFCVATIFLSHEFIGQAWSVREGSPEVSGLPYVYLLKTGIAVFAALLAIQGIAGALRSLMTIAGSDRDERSREKVPFP